MKTLYAKRVSRRSSFRAVGVLTTLPWISVLPGFVQPWAAVPASGALGRVIRVGPTSEVQTLSEASRIARDGDTVEVAPGEYRRDVAVWSQQDLVIRGVGRRPSLIADGASADAKATFIVRGDRVRIENLGFFGARVPHRNGAGIRLEKGHLEIAGCHFEDNENGVLTNNDSAIELSIDRCSFVENGAGDGQSHNLYAGLIGRLTVSSSYFARSRVGHLLKSRARESLVAYSRFSGEDGTSSYELEFPNGGTVHVMSCLIQQGPRSENATIVSCGAEGYRWPRTEVHLVFNTIVNNRLLGGVFVRAASGRVRVEVLDNLLVGAGHLDLKAESVVNRNSVGRRSEFADPTRMNYRLRKSSVHVGAAGQIGNLAPGRSYPSREYLHPANSQELPVLSPSTPLNPGAFQLLEV